MPYTYREMQEWIVNRRRQQARAAAHGATGDIVKTADDLVTRLQDFACDAVVTKHLIEFALPYRFHPRAAEVSTKQQPTVYERLQQTTDSSNTTPATVPAATEHEHHTSVVLPTADTTAQAATEHQRDQPAADAPSAAATKDKDTEFVVRLSETAAKTMAEKFMQFVTTHRLNQCLSRVSAGQIVVLCIFHSRLLWQKGKPIELHDRDQHWIPKPVYTPASAVNAPSPPHFVQRLKAAATEHGAPVIPAPRVCCLCGKGFVDAPSLQNHCRSEHHSWAEARKRMLWEAQDLHAIPLLPQDKRRIIHNFAEALMYSQPAEGHFGHNNVCMRQRVGCATCAKVAWIEHCFPCYLFKECPLELKKKDEDTDDEGAQSDDSEDSATHATEHRQTQLLRDEHGYYISDAHRIHELLDVTKYIEAWPQIPIEDLHASSVQHPQHPEYRWLLNTRRVPVIRPDESVATERALPPCAGIGCPEDPVWLCKSCTKALCRHEPQMPFFALANWNWGGRVHPLYYDLSIAEQHLLCLAIMVCKLIVLRYSEHEDDQEKGLVGNTIMLSQPSPDAILQKLPPPDAEMPKYVPVCFNSSTMSREDVAKHKALWVDRDLYIKRAELRRRVNPVFEKVDVDVEACRSQLPELGVPTAILEGAQGMDTLNTFQPTFDGPAKMKDPMYGLESPGEATEDIDDELQPDASALDCGIDDHYATEPVEGTKQTDMPSSDYLVGVSEDNADDPVDQMLALQTALEAYRESARKLHDLEQRRQEATEAKTDDATEAAAAVAAEQARNTSVLVVLREVSKKMKDDFQNRLDAKLKDAKSHTATSQTLRIQSGAPLNMFDPPSWSKAFVQFFYGDCAPNLGRPVRTNVREQFHYLTVREELEYHLPSDDQDPLIPGGCYRAPAHSRWNTPEFVTAAADHLRKISILYTTQPAWQNKSGKFGVDVKLIAKAKTEDFQKLGALMSKRGQQSVAEMMRVAKEHGLLPLYKALQYVTFQTANIPLTQGYKMSLRQLGFGLNIYDGPLTVFLTTNFADTYSPITVVLRNGAGEPLGKRSINLLESVPHMPTLQSMHRALTKHPMLQVELLLLLDKLVHTELLCTDAFIGREKYDFGHNRTHPTEDDFASTGEIGIAHFVRALLKALEAQGRGFAHGHEKVISVPRTRAARLEELFAASATEHGENELTRFCDEARKAILEAAETLQYDSAVLPGTQLGVHLRPEPFTEQQQKRSRFDGAVEEADDNAPLRDLLPVFLSASFS
jgi:hypothetical protein